jgi:uncharacterized membrane protein (UPF0127 family)
MNWRGPVMAGGLVLVLLGVGLLAYGAGLVEYPGEDEYQEAEVTFVAENGTELATVDVTVADTRKERIQGLSGVESLPEDSGMLFVTDGETRRTLVMRDMEIPLDMVFVGANGTVTTVHEAPLPPADREELKPYRGVAQWMVELPYGYAEEHGIEPGVRVRVEYADGTTAGATA